MKSAPTNEYCLTSCLLRGQFLVFLVKMFYGFTKSVKGHEICPILMKTSKQVPLLGKFYNFLVKMLYVSLKVIEVCPPNENYQQVITVSKHKFSTF